MNEDFSNLKPRPLEDITNGSELNKPKQMERITTMGNVSAKETTELLVALGKLGTSFKESIDDDGKITTGDAFNFTDDIMPLLAGIKDANKIPAEFKDGFDDIEKADMRNQLAEAMELDPNDEKAVDAGLDVIFALQNFFLVTGIIKSNG